jgi:hypothetical protein
LPNKLNFNELGNQVACIDCDLRDFVWNLPTELQEKHYLEHNSYIASNTTTVITDRGMMQRICRVCNTPFEQERRRGRPYLECLDCKS